MSDNWKPNGRSNGHGPADGEDWDPESYRGLADALDAEPDAPPIFISDDASEQWFGSCKLRTILTRPRRHELTCPGGQRVVLSTEDLLSVPRFITAFVDEVGSFPPLPKKGAAKLLREMTAHWLEHRETVVVDEEAGQFGLLVAEIRRSLVGASESDDPKHLALGAVIAMDDGDRLFAPRPIMVRVRAGGLCQFRPGEFYAALRELGCTQRDSNFVKGVRARAWRAPAVMWMPAPGEPQDDVGGSGGSDSSGVANSSGLALH